MVLSLVLSLLPQPTDVASAMVFFATFGFRSISLDIGLRRLFPWIFVVADVPTAILAADFLAAFELLGDWRQLRLYDRATALSVNGFHPLPLSNRPPVLNPIPDYRFIGWPEAIRQSEIAAPKVVKAFLSPWFAVFGAPSTITTDRGAQFESNLFHSLLSFLGYTRVLTTAYHPAAIGMVEPFHRQLKTSLRAAADPENRTDHLSLVLLGIRSALKPDLDCYAAELVFGATV
ncbi:hypothetical protein SprV_0301061500 [Sparganum proliferum]